MRTRHRIALSRASLALVTVAIPLAAQPRGDGQHDFDFEHGRWHVHLARLVKALSHSTIWTTLDGTSVVRPVWGGLANLGELEVDGGGTHIRGLSLRVYDPKARQCRIPWANSRDGVLGPAMVGGFSGGRGEFYDQEDFEGRPIFVRFIFSDIAARSFKIEQAFSDDGGSPGRRTGSRRSRRTRTRHRRVPCLTPPTRRATSRSRKARGRCTGDVSTTPT